MLFVRSTKDTYKDININFLAHPETGQLSVLKNENAIKQQIKNLVLTNRYETLFRPDVYGGIYDAQFDSFDPITVQKIKTAIKDVIENYSSNRAELISLTLENDLDHNGIAVQITFVPMTSNTPVTVDIFLSRIR